MTPRQARCTTTPPRRARALALGLSLALSGCGDDSPPPADDATAGGTDDPTPDTDPVDSLDESGTPAQDCDFQESFDVADGQPWPAPWTDLGGVALADVQGGRGRLVPVVSGYSLARIGVPLDCTDAEATFSFEFTDATTQGVGFYVRQNGGYLQSTTPTGLGYAAFAENFRTPVGIGAWREIGGSEEQLEAIEPFAIETGVVYRVRLRVTQDGSTRTLVQVKIWRDGEAEPEAWQVERTDDTPELQRLSGGIAVDAWSSLTAGQPFEMFVDDIVVTAAP